MLQIKRIQRKRSKLDSLQNEIFCLKQDIKLFRSGIDNAALLMSDMLERIKKIEQFQETIAYTPAGIVVEAIKHVQNRS
jgi:hypothetical protein